jgi:cysteine desulfurase
MDVRKLGVDALSLSGSKCFGPKSSGILWTKTGSEVGPLWFESGTKFPLRPGTEDVMSVGPCVAAYSAFSSRRSEFVEKVTLLRDYFESGLGLVSKGSPEFDVHITCQDHERSAHISHCTFVGVTGERMVVELNGRGFAASARSACGSSESETLSASLISYFEAIEKSGFEERGSLRISFGPWHTKRDVDRLLSAMHHVFVKIQQEQAIVNNS